MEAKSATQYLAVAAAPGCAETTRSQPAAEEAVVTTTLCGAARVRRQAAAWVARPVWRDRRPARQPSAVVTQTALEAVNLWEAAIGLYPTAIGPTVVVDQTGLQGPCQAIGPEPTSSTRATQTVYQ